MTVDHPAFVEPQGEELFRHAVVVVDDYAVGHVEDVGRGAVVLVERNVGGRLEIDKYLRIRAAPGIDRLVGVTNHEEIAVMLGEDVQKFPVVARTVLNLVDHNIVELVGPVLTRILEMVEDIDGEIDQVVVVEGVLLELQPHIPHLRVGAVGRTGRKKMSLDIGVDVIPFQKGHFLQESLRRELAAVDSELVHRLLGQCLGILFVDDGEAFRITDAVNLAPQEFHAEAMDGADEVVDRSAVDHPRDAPFHLLGGLVGEGEAEDIAGGYAEFVDKESVAVCEHARLARTGSGHYTHPPFRCLHGLLLTLVELHHPLSSTFILCFRHLMFLCRTLNRPPLPAYSARFRCYGACRPEPSA